MKSSKPIQDFLINGLMDLNIIDMQGLLNYDPAYAKACCEDENYKNEINPEVLSKKIFESINYYLTFELTKHQSSATIQYSYKHKLKLIERFIPIIETFGKTDIAFLKAMEAHPVCGCEITKTIRSIETVRDLLRAKITDLYNEIEIKWQQSNADDDLYGFFNKIKEGKITSLEVNNYIKNITDNYSSKKLKALNEEFYHFFSLLQESRLTEYALFENKENIPFKRYLNEDKLSLITESDDKNLVDDNGHLFPNEFSGCYEFQELLEGLLINHNNISFIPEVKMDGSEQQEENTEFMIKRILNPLKEIGSHGTVILDKDSFEILVSTYVNWIDRCITPNKADRFKFHGTNKEFYTPLFKLHKELNIKYAGIGQVLTYILQQNNKHGDVGRSIAPSTIEKNIKECGKY